MEGIIPIIIGILVLLSQDHLLDYYQKINRKYSQTIDRKILFVRLIIGGTFLIILGITLIISSRIN